MVLQYRAKRKQLAARSSRTAQERLAAVQAAEAIYRRCLTAAPRGMADCLRGFQFESYQLMTPASLDGRAYVGLGRLLVRQRRYGEAQALYEDGSRMTEGSNCYIWQARRARTARSPGMQRLSTV